ncbi:MAG: type II secretion system F family protein [Verrucomicrobia bacterium]|nr:type II secretion system F family protein [Verrucomicrobiota bacterium]
MPDFAYNARTKAGESITGVLAAPDRKAALSQLSAQGYFPVAVDVAKQKKGAPAARTSAGRSTATGSAAAPAPKKGRVGVRQVMVFTQQLANLLKSGMSLKQAIESLARQQKGKPLGAILEQVGADILQGTNLSDALARNPRVFSRLYTNMVRAGEQSGTLPEVLKRLTEHYVRLADIHEKVISALLYPAIVLIVGIGVVFVFMVFMLPKFAQMFKDLGATLPLPTRILIGVGNTASNPWVLLGMGALVAGCIYAYRRTVATREGRMTMDRLKLRIPVVSGAAKAAFFAQFSRTLATLLSNGVPVLIALKIVEDTMTNTVIAQEIANARERVTDGTTISAPLAAGQIFPSLLIEMLAIGEQTGDMPGALNNVADIYEDQLTQDVKRFTTLLEPVVIVMIALVVGMIVFSVLSAVMSLTAGINR